MNRVATAPDLSSFPDRLRPYLTGAPVYDSSCSGAARVWYIDRDGGIFLKRAPVGTLETEAKMTAWFRTLGLSAEVVDYTRYAGYDFFLTRRLPGEDCTHKMYLEKPEKLCNIIGEQLRLLHETLPVGCPIPDRNKSYRTAVIRGHEHGKYESDLFRGLWEFSSPEETWQAARLGMAHMKRDVLVHGDYCLPNIILNGWQFSGFIDLGNSGVGDRHIDILWGIWTLNFNLHTVRHTDRFMDAYGRELIDPDQLRYTAAMEMIGE